MAWIEFYSPKLQDGATVNCPPDTVLYDPKETGISAYRAARNKAARRLKRRHGLHPCAKVEMHPHDWSDDLDPDITVISGKPEVSVNH